MKRSFVCLLSVCALTLPATAALVLDEPFSYADGSLTNVSGNLWTNHSGADFLEVQAGKAIISQTRASDVNRLLDGQPHTTGSLYASFVVNFSTLPSSGGAYFWHLKDSSTGFRARVFASTSGAGANQLRLGIANAGGTATSITSDLSLNTDYLVVVRYNCTTAVSTVWISPPSESSTASRADGSDSTSAIPIVAAALRQASGEGILTLDNLKVGTAFSDVTSGGDTSTNPPSITLIGTQSIPANSATAAIPFQVTDGETPSTGLTVSADSSNVTLVPVANIVLGGDSANRTVTITPAASQQGTAVITLTVTDGDGNSTSTSFTVIVGAPTISSVPNQIIPANTPTPAIPFTVGDAETPNSLTVVGYSSNPSLLPPANIAISGTGTNRTVVLTPAAGQVGAATVNLAVSDGVHTVSNRFVLTVTQPLGLIWSEPFTYPDGSIVSGSSFAWNAFSPPSPLSDALVLNNKLLLSGTNGDDVQRLLYGDAMLPPEGYFPTNSGYLAYASLEVTFLALPSSAGDYFAQFRGLSAFLLGRVFGLTSGAAPGKFRIGVANNANNPTGVLTNDLSTNVTYVVTLRHNPATAESRIWVNAFGESDYAVDATDVAIPTDLYNFAFRQSGGIGTLTVDNLRVGGTFASVYQEPKVPPTISDIADLTTPYQTSTGPIAFTVGDLVTPATSLAVSASSTNQTLVPNANILLGGSGSNRTVTVTPAAGQFGTTLITVTVTNAAGLTASDSFVLTVLGLNNPPSISAIPAQTTAPGTPIAAIPFTIGDAESPASSLNLRGTSANPTLVPEANIQFGGSGPDRTVTITPAAGQVGSAAITVFVDDGVLTNSTTFSLSVNPPVLLADTFSYTDGPVTTNSGFLWNAHSGTAGQTQVASGKLNLNGTDSEDINAALTNAPFTVAGGAVLYAGFTVNFSALPGSQYFAHFRDTSTGFRGRVFSTLSNATTGTFRLGVANNAGSLGVTNPPLAQDLTLNTDYRVVLRYNVGTGVLTLWVNPSAESDSSVTATDTPGVMAISTFAFRQAPGIGTLTVDDLIVGTSFDAVAGAAPARPSLTIVPTGPASVRISWPKSATDAGYVLQRTTGLLGGWSNSADQGSVVGEERVVELLNVTGSEFFQLAKP